MKLKDRGFSVVVVTSGTVGAGLKHMGKSSRPKVVNKVQVKSTSFPPPVYFTGL